MPPGDKVPSRAHSLVQTELIKSLKMGLTGTEKGDSGGQWGSCPSGLCLSHFLGTSGAGASPSSPSPSHTGYWGGFLQPGLAGC